MNGAREPTKIWWNTHKREQEESEDRHQAKRTPPVTRCQTCRPWFAWVRIQKPDCGIDL